MQINDMIQRIREINVSNGWRDGSVEEPDTDHAIMRLALVMTEVAEAIEEVRANRPVGATYYSGGIDEDRHGFMPDSSVPRDALGHPRKPEGVPSELADILIRVLDLADEWGIDIEQVALEKLAYNATRGKRHGGKAA